MIGLNHFLVLSAILFFIGVAGVLSRKNILITLMSIELMLNAVNLTFIAFSRFHASMDGHVAVFLVIAVAAAEAAVGLGIVVSVFRNRSTVNTDELTLLRD
jgi:NADH-quinone oxidoreductase subunit K